MWQLAASLWHDLSAAEQAQWESQGTARGMTGFAWYMSQALRPNPGIYLPLAGGTMSGVIEMNDQHIHGLPAPVHLQDPLRRQDYVDYIQPFLIGHGARVHANIDRAIPNDASTAIIFDAADYDNDNLWRPGTSTSRLYITTAGIYLVIGQVLFDASGPATRRITLDDNTPSALAVTQLQFDEITGHWRAHVSTTWYFSAEDFVELRAFQDTGAPLNVVSYSNASPVLQAVRIG